MTFASQTEPYVHIDFDTFIFDRINFEKYELDEKIKSFINNCYSFKSMIQTQHKSYIRDVFVVGKNNDQLIKTKIIVSK